MYNFYWLTVHVRNLTNFITTGLSLICCHCDPGFYAGVNLVNLVNAHLKFELLKYINNNTICHAMDAFKFKPIYL